MKFFSISQAWIPGMVLALLLGTVAVVGAAEPATVELQVDPEVGLGDTVNARISVKDGRGAPISGATVILLSPADFGATSGEMRLGRVITGPQGQATFAYQARREGPQKLVARLAPGGGYAPAEASVSLNVQGSAQLYEQHSAGIEVPGIGVWILVMLLGGFWSVYLVVMVLAALIAREGGKVQGLEGGSSG